MPTRKLKIKNTKPIRVKVLDFAYKVKSNHLNLKYIIYSVAARNEKQAIEEARSLYMQGITGIGEEKLPLSLKVFTIMKE